MRARRLAAAVAPHGVVRSATRWTGLRRLGVCRRRAAAVATSSRRWAAVDRAGLTLLPAGAVAQLRSVVDVGANVGRWTEAVLDVAQPARMLLVEPTPSLAAALREGVGTRSGVHVAAVAAGSGDGEVELRVASHGEATSVLEPRAEMDDLYGYGYQVVDRVPVPQRSLDAMLEDWAEVSLLKIDVQGYERDVLAGAAGVLRRTRWVLVEALFRSHYVGDLTFPGLHELMTKAAFDLRGMSPPFVAGGMALWADALYERRDAVGGSGLAGPASGHTT